MSRDDSRWGQGRGYRGWSQSQSGKHPRDPAWQHDYGHAAGSPSDYDPDYERGFRSDERFNHERDYRSAQPSGMSGEPYRPGWPEQRGGFGEREYGQGGQDYGSRGYDPMYGPHWYDQARGYYGYGDRPGTEARGLTPEQRRRLEAVRYWPHESMGMMTNMPYYGGAQYGASGYGGAYPQPWGGGMGFGAEQPGISPMLRQTWPAPAYGEAAWGSSDHEPQGPLRRDARGSSGYAGLGPKGYHRSDDRIHEEICEKLTRDPRIDASTIEIHVESGEVKLTGHVHERRYKHMAEDVAESVSGVKKIRNDIDVEHHPGFQQEWREGASGEAERFREPGRGDASPSPARAENARPKAGTIR